jgi:hypothetical protein
MTNPFQALDLTAGPYLTSTGLSDDDVRSAWRRIAAATHPDRADGGDPAAFAAAAAAYTQLRTAAGRAEALGDLAGQAGSRTTSRPVGPPLAGPVHRLAWRIGRGRPLRLALRLLAVAAAGALPVVVIGWQPASAAVITGALTWLALTGRADLAERPRRS